MICPRMSGLVVLSEDKVEFHTVDCAEEKCGMRNACTGANKKIEFQQGVDALRDNNDTSINVSPYRNCTIEYFMWRTGWQEAYNVALMNDQHPRQLGCKASDE